MSRASTRNVEPAPRFADEQLLLTARLYYIDGLPQADVARLTGVSQPQVSRMLALARERGIVQITVADYTPRDTNLEQQLETSFGLTRAVVIKVAAGVTPEDVRRTMGHFAAPYLTEFISAAHTVAIAGGRTLSSVIRSLTPAAGNSSLQVVQAMGNIGAVPDSWDALELGRAIASRWGGAFQMLNTPAFLPDAKTRNTLLKLPQIASVKETMRQADLALVGVGTVANSVFVERQVLPAGDFTRLGRSGAAGEICGRYFDAAGKECATPLRDRVISIELEELRAVPNVIAVVSGPDRAAALQAAICGGLVKSLMIDSACARALLQLNPAAKDLCPL